MGSMRLRCGVCGNWIHIYLHNQQNAMGSMRLRCGVCGNWIHIYLHNQWNAMAMGNRQVEWHEVTVWCVWQLDSYLLTQSMECYGWHEVTVWCVWQLDSYLLTQSVECQGWHEATVSQSKSGNRIYILLYNHQ